ncbi:MAG TPA: carboxypeptidase-like regulatory domain-containing protein, partial [Chitinophagaceae bacterium]|nr:carboxypeptidase-like regulatory domain-containing protein [Chitinophagaceae bacterium]
MKKIEPTFKENNRLWFRKGIYYSFCFFFILFISVKSFSQNIQVSGRVTGDSAQPISGVSVTVMGGSSGTSTDATGAYTVSAPATGTLIFSSVGFASQQVPINNRTTVNVTLTAAAAQQLEQVVVVGYGTQRRRDVTGSVASVTGAEIARQPVQTATQAIQGRVAGVQVISSGQPNSLPVVRVRGTGTMLTGTNPL